MVLDSGSQWELEDFQCEIVEDIFAGAREVWAILPEGCAKTTLLSGLALYHGDYTPTASVPIGASSRDQCGILIGQAAGFIERTPALRKRFRFYPGYRRIVCLRTDGVIQVHAADERTGDGVIPTFPLLDELHRHRDLRLYRTWLGKLDKRGGQLVAISTAGEPDTEFEQIRSNLRAAGGERDGGHLRVETGGMVLHDWSLPPGADSDDMKAVKAANPLAAITPATLKRKRESPAMSTPHWRRFTCNEAVRVSESAVTEAELVSATTDELVPEGEPVSVGIDLGWKIDTTALVPLWEAADYRQYLPPAILVPPRDGTSLHPSVIQDAFLAINERNPVERVVLDPEAGGEQFAAWLEDKGFSVIAWSQKNSSQCVAYDRFMDGLRGGTLRFPPDPNFARHIRNAIARVLPDGRTRFDRPSQSRAVSLQERRVIDALDAAAYVNAALGENTTSVYETRGLLTL